MYNQFKTKMKRITIINLALFAGFIVFSQTSRLKVSKELINQPLRGVSFISNNDHVGQNTSSQIVPGLKLGDWTEENLGQSRYDLQTNYSSQNRIFLFDNGTVGATWTRGIEETAFPDRGTGYNYFDDSDWGVPSLSRG